MIRTGRTALEAIEAALKDGYAVVTNAKKPESAAQIGQAKPTEAAEPFGVLRLTIRISPLRVASEANIGGRLRSKIVRKIALKRAVERFLPDFRFPLPCKVTLIRVGGRPLDEDDNLRRALKAPKDVLSQWLGVKDTGRDRRVKWLFRQQPGYTSGLTITIEQVPQ